MNDLLPKDLPFMKKIIFKTFYSIHFDSCDSSAKFYLQFLSQLIRLVQFLSIIIFSASSVQFYSDSSLLVYILSFSRLDYMLVSSGQSQSFVIISLTITITSLLLKFVVALQIHNKKRIFFSAFATLCWLNIWLVFSIVQICFSLYTFDCLQGYFTGSSKLYPNSSYSFDTTYAPFIALVFVLLAVEGFVDIVLGNIPKFSKKTHSRVHSMLQVQELFITLILGPCVIFQGSNYFLYIYIAISIYSFYCYYYYMPFVCNIFNGICLQTWSSVLVGGVLVLVGKKFNNYYIIELNLPILSFALIIINGALIKNRSERCLKTKSVDPYTLELKLRILLIKEEDNEKASKLIFDSYKIANEDFTSFTIQYVWESILIKKHVKNINLSLLKLVKINTLLFAVNQPHLTSKDRKIQYPYTLETQFLLYSVFQKYHKKLKDAENDLALIKYFTNYKSIRDLDEKILTCLLEFISCIESDSTSQTIKKRIKEIGSMIINYVLSAKKMIKKFGVDKKFVRLYGGFLKDVMNSPRGIELMTEFGLVDLAGGQILDENLDADKSDPMMVISGWHRNIGIVVYANSAIYKLLGIHVESKLVGTSFTLLIPKPFDAIHDGVLYRFLFHRNNPELGRSHLFLIDANQNCIEVTMRFRMAFYRCNPYFIAHFKVINSGKSMILCSYQGEIFSCSEKIKEMLPGVEFNVFVSLPGFEECLKRHEFGVRFEFERLGKNFYVKKSSLEIDGYKMMVLYFTEIDFGQIARNEARSKKKVKIEEDSMNSQIGKTAKETELKKENAVEVVEGLDRLNLKSAKRSAKILNYSIKILMLIEFTITLTILVIILKIIQSLSVNSIVSDIGLMRYLSTSILSNTQSLQLLSQNFSLAFTESTYKSTLQQNALDLKSLLETYRVISLPFLNQNKEYFNTEQIQMFTFTSDSFTTADMTLLTAIQQIINDASILSQIGIGNLTSAYPLWVEMFRNVPSVYINSLTKTVKTISDDLAEALAVVFQYLQYLELVCIIPPIVLILIAGYSLFVIEKANLKFWEFLSNVKKAEMMETQIKLIDRLNFVHEIEYVNENLQTKNTRKNRQFVFIVPMLKLMGLSVLSLVFYFSLTLSPQNSLVEMFQAELNHTNYGGMRRMLTPLSLFWARESFLEAGNLTSYINFVPEYLVSCSADELEYRVDELREIQDDLMRSLRELVEKGYGFEPYLALMLGNACGVINNVQNCEETLVAKGLDTGMKDYLNEIERTYQISKTGFKNDSFVEIEIYSKVIENSFVFGLSVYGNYTDGIINTLKIDMVVATVVYLAVIVVYFVFVLNSLATSLVRNLENKIEILAVLVKDPSESKKRGSSIPIQLRHSFSTLSIRR